VQLAADYSPVDYNFSAGYQQGIMASYSADMFKAMFSIGNGLGQTNGSWSNEDTNSGKLNFAARVEAKLAGSWGQFNKETSFRGEEFGLLLGAGWIDSDGRAGGNYGELDSHNNALTFDATAFWGGANLSAAYIYASDNDNAGSHSYGVTVQGGLFVTDKVEVWGAWNYIDGKGGAEDGNWAQAGATVYFAKNGCKWTTQLNIPLNDDTNEDYLYGGAWGLSVNDETSFLTQLQFMF